MGKDLSLITLGDREMFGMGTTRKEWATDSSNHVRALRGTFKGIKKKDKKKKAHHHARSSRKPQKSPSRIVG